MSMDDDMVADDDLVADDDMVANDDMLEDEDVVGDEGMLAKKNKFDLVEGYKNLPFWATHLLKEDSRGRQSLTLNEKKLILVGFYSYLEKNILPRRKDITNEIKKDQYSSLREKKGNGLPETISGCIRNFFRKKKKNNI